MEILTVDIGGTFLKYARMAEDMTVLSRGKVKTPGTRDELIEMIGRIYDKNPEIDGIAISMPGIIDSQRGYCAMGGALRYNDDFYIQQELYRRCPVAIYVANDAKCAAMAEAAAGSLRDVEDGFVLLFGTMIGGGYIKDRRLHFGKHFAGGEVSFINTQRDSSPTADAIWGNQCGTPRLCTMYAQQKQLPPEQVDGVMVFDAANAGEPEALACLRQFTREIAVQIFNLQTILDVERFAIGGGISAQPLFIEYIRNSLKALYAECPYYVPQAEVVCCKFQNDANLIGALQFFLTHGRTSTDTN